MPADSSSGSARSSRRRRNFNGIAALANPGAFRTWLFRTTRHRAIDWLRARRRERELFADTSPDDIGRDEPAGEPGAELDEAELDAALGAIPPLHREVLLLRYRDDLTYEEIAVVLGVPIGTVRTRLHYAKQRLRTFLRREDP